MRKLIILMLCAGCATYGSAQTGGGDTLWKKIYRGSAAKINDLVDTRLEAKFDYAKSYLYGKVRITLQPHFYPTDSLTLDAKQMEIGKVLLAKGNGVLMPLHFEYDGWALKIKLDRVYRAHEKYTVVIGYTAKPNEAKVPADEKGLYFINPKGDQVNKPVQIWTDGETEKTSVWCPIIDKPDQKTTLEMILTVPDKYLTLSNGRLAGQQKNADGTRTDDWKMELPLAPYVFFMAVGDFAVTRDHYKGKEVNYYTEKEYAANARRIFGLTPAMMAFFGKITGVPFPWVKYSQIVLRDFTSTAMENTTATAHAERAQQDDRELADGNGWEDNTSHELFHQWFGDYVTCESWSNLTLNESFARYGEYLWREHQYGVDNADDRGADLLRDYLANTGEQDRSLVRFYYSDAEDLFDGISYGKGSLILHMLREYVGDSAFFSGLNLYLTRYKFQSAEAHQLRLVMEEVSGLDLNWFFNQWYFGGGHPKITIGYAYDDAAGRVAVMVRQGQGADHLFRIPVTIDVYNGAARRSYPVWITKETDTFYLPYSSTRPDLVNVGAGKLILWDKKDDETVANLIHQYTYAGTYTDRRQAIGGCGMQQQYPAALELLKTALKDPSDGLRQFTISVLNMKSEPVRQAVEPILYALAKEDPKRPIRGYAIQQLAGYRKNEYRDLFMSDLDDSSYFVAGAALTALTRLDSAAGYREAKRLAGQETKYALVNVILVTLIQHGSADDFDLIARKFAALSFRIRIARNFADYLGKITDGGRLEKGVDLLTGFRGTELPLFTPAINKALSELAAKKEAAGLPEQAGYIRSKLPG